MQMNDIVIFMLTFYLTCSLQVVSLLAFVHNLAHSIHNVKAIEVTILEVRQS